MDVGEGQCCESNLDVSSFIRYDSVSEIRQVRRPTTAWRRAVRLRQAPARIVNVDHGDSERGFGITITRIPFNGGFVPARRSAEAWYLAARTR